MKRTIGFITIVAMLFTMIPAFGVTAASPAPGEKVSITVPNGDFEQSKAVDITQKTYTDPISGWDVEYRAYVNSKETNPVAGDKLFHQVINGGSGNNSNVAHIYDNCDTNTSLGDYRYGQIILASDYLDLPAVGQSTAVDYEVDFDYIAPGYDTSGGQDLYVKGNTRLWAGIIFYNDAEQYYNDQKSAWTALPSASAVCPLNAQWNDGARNIYEWKNDGKEYPIQSGEWGTVNLPKTAPVGATKAKVFFVANGNNKFDFAVDNVEMSYIQPDIEVSGASVTNGDFEADAPAKNGTITGWTYAVNAGAALNDTDLYYEIKADEGDQSLYIHDNSATYALGVISDKITVVPGNQYQFTYSYKTTRGIPTSVNFYNAEGNVYDFATQEWLNPNEGDHYGMPNGIGANKVLNDGGKSTYTTLSTENYTAPKDAVSVAIAFYGTSARNNYLIHVDDVTIAETPMAADITAPSDVADPQIKAGNAKIDISFTEPSDADYTMTKLYVDNVMTAILKKGTTAYTLSDLTNDQAYEIKLVSYDSSNNGSAGIVQTVTPKAPAVNSAPTVPSPIGSKTIWADERIELDLSTYFTDVDEDVMTFRADKGTVSGSSYTYLPSAEDIAAKAAVLNITADDGLGGVTTDTIQVTIKEVPNEKPADTDTVGYLNVKNPGFERTAAGTKNTNLVGWTPQFSIEANQYYDDSKYFDILTDDERKTADGDAGNVLHIYKNDGNEGLFLGSDLIEVPDYNVNFKTAYTLSFDYNTTNVLGLSIAFYNADKQLWKGTAWGSAGTWNNDHQKNDANGVNCRGVFRGDTNPAPEKNTWSHFEHTRTAPAGTKYVRVFILAHYNWGGYNFKADNVKVSYAIEKKNLTVTSTGNGTVTPSGTTSVIKGSQQTITAVPADGWEISKITVNSVEQPIKENFSVTVDADTTVEVTFAELPETPPTINTFDKTYVPDDKTNSVTFGTVAEGSKTTVKEYGIVYSATDSADPQIGKENCYKLKAEKALSANGHYGIEIKGDLLLNTTYYTRTYVIYEKEDGTEAILYGEIKTIALQ